MRLRAFAAALSALLSGCLQIPLGPGGSGSGGLAQDPRRPLPQLASYAISGDRIEVYNTASDPWFKTRITIYGDRGYFHQKAGTVDGDRSVSLALDQFADQSGVKFTPAMAIKSVWVHARSTNDRPVDAMAAPSAEFGLRPPSP